jgi:hypothetical protein
MVASKKNRSFTPGLYEQEEVRESDRADKASSSDEIRKQKWI